MKKLSARETTKRLRIHSIFVVDCLEISERKTSFPSSEMACQRRLHPVITTRRTGLMYLEKLNAVCVGILVEDGMTTALTRQCHHENVTRRFQSSASYSANVSVQVRH